LLNVMLDIGPGFVGKDEHRKATADLDAITIPEGGASARFEAI